MMLIERVDDPDQTTRAAIQAVIDPYNEAQVGHDEPTQLFGALLRDDAGVVIGGGLASVYWEWLFVNMIALPETARGQGVGTRIMRSLEREAVRRGCRGMWLDTATYQAPDFYRKLGFVEFGRIPNYGPGWSRHWMLKTPLADWPDQGIEIVEDPDDPARETVRSVLNAYSDARSGPGKPTLIAGVVRAGPGEPILGGFLWPVRARLDVPRTARLARVAARSGHWHPAPGDGGGGNGGAGRHRRLARHLQLPGAPILRAARLHLLRRDRGLSTAASPHFMARRLNGTRLDGSPPLAEAGGATPAGMG